MNFMAGIGYIQVRPNIAPANKIGEGIVEARDARHDSILAVLDDLPRATIAGLAKRLNYPEALVRNDVAILINKGELKDSWKGKTRYIRRSIL